jgi:hypothetical protein
MDEKLNQQIDLLLNSTKNLLVEIERGKLTVDDAVKILNEIKGEQNGHSEQNR